jgi:tetratricopeptide (TPR) repeat protein
MLKACYLARLNREEEGFQLIDQAAEVDPKNDQVLIARAEYYQQYCNTEKSLEIFDEIISDPELNSAKVHYYKSKTLEDTNQLDEAVKELHKAINMDDSDNIDYYISLGSIYVRQNKLRLAEISFKKAAELLPCLEAFWELARVKERMGCYYDALDYYNMALKEDPLNDIVMITRNRLRTKIACGDDKTTIIAWHYSSLNTARFLSDVALFDFAKIGLPDLLLAPCLESRPDDLLRKYNSSSALFLMTNRTKVTF